ncbi:RICIN domain-containing protein [Chitinophaga sp. Cy-1792]|uniref:DUF3472 domain-containing protein n=1 Tax=Chitinophaga sp. Cy-1792 TaxID=2608339 RepID=UPI00141EC346|nr:RICIN domain-containing protein [Chitinophaga sp. Cy-1792]NIG56759.1 DUF3472 domain-containing protein [Chitinophaga sp. Cy-1792]
MKKSLRTRLYACLWCLGMFVFLMPEHTNAQGAAPSEHLVFSFPADAVLKMHKVKIVQSAYTEYFEMNSFTSGYAGLQQTPDSSKGSSHTLISSLWDPNTSAGIYSSVAYQASNTYTGRFGGEGDGYQSINPYNWVMNTWYNQVIRAWKSNGQLYVATFMNNLSTNQWFHTVTLAMPAPSNFLGSGNDAFLENWDSNVKWNGAFVRKAFFKDCWNLNTSGVWQKHTSRYFSANAGDSARNGIYDRAFDAGYDSTEDAYYMVHGGSTTPGAGFGTGRTLTLPAQTNQGTAPVITAGVISSVTASYASGITTVNWTNDNTTSPQLSAKVEILDAGGTVLYTQQDTLPQKRSTTFMATLSAGSYTARVTVRDIFNNLSAAVTGSFTVSGRGTDTTFYKFKNAYSNLYLGVKDSSTANSATISQYAGSNSYNLQWYASTQSNGSIVLINRRSGKALDLPGSAQTAGTHPIQYTVTNGTNQQWNLVVATGSTFLIQSNMSNHYVLDDSASSTLQGTGIILYAASGTSGSANQQWYQESVSSGLSSLSGAAVSAALMPAPPVTASVLQVFPNPAVNVVNITCKKMNAKMWIWFYDVPGRVVKRVAVTGSPMQVDISSLLPGTYFVKYGNETVTFVKE